MKSEKNNRQIRRITRYENMYDDATELLKTGQNNERLSKLVKKLEAYYTGTDWKKDYTDDESGKLPTDLKRGVLSEDGIDGLLEEYKEKTDGNG